MPKEGEKWVSDPLKQVVSHPEFSTLATPASVELDETERRLINLGLGVDVSAKAQDKMKVFKDEDNQLQVEDLDRIPIQCFNCGGQGEYVVAVTNVPKFGRAEISSFSCDDCGYAVNSTRPEKSVHDDQLDTLGSKIRLNVATPEDLERTVIQSDAASLCIPEIEFAAAPGEGVYSTVEGVLYKYISKFKFMVVANVDKGELGSGLESKFQDLLDNLRKNGTPFTLELDDPYSDSHISHLSDEHSDTRLSIERYERTSEHVDAAEDSTEKYVEYSAENLQKGSHVQAKYGEKWFENCVIVNRYNEHTFFVVQKEHEDEGGWQVGIDEMRSPSGEIFVTKHVSHSDMSAKYLMDTLNIMAEHVQLKEDSTVVKQKRLEKQMEQKRLERDVETLNDLD